MKPSLSSLLWLHTFLVGTLLIGTMFT